jgi:predicted nuclease of predicted toxin-antitoxin system
MSFLTDQDVYAITVRFLKALGHDVETAAKLGLARAPDLEILRAAHVKNRILLTRDRDFGGLVFVQGVGAGIVYLRMLPSTCDVVHAELERVLKLYDEETLKSSFVVVESGRHRIRKAIGNP